MRVALATERRCRQGAVWLGGENDLGSTAEQDRGHHVRCAAYYVRHFVLRHGGASNKCSSNTSFWWLEVQYVYIDLPATKTSLKNPDLSLNLE